MRQLAYITDFIEQMPPAPLRVYIADDSPPVAEMLTELIAIPGRIEVLLRDHYGVDYSYLAVKVGDVERLIEQFADALRQAAYTWGAVPA